jgi:hypothetical protein
MTEAARLDEEDLAAIGARLRATRFPDGKFQIDTFYEPEALGRWRMVSTFAADPTPRGPIVWVWIGPERQVLVERVPMRRADLRSLVGEVGTGPNPEVTPRVVAMVVVQCDGFAHQLRDALTGEFEGLPERMQARLHPPRIEKRSDRDFYAFWARDIHGATSRWLAELEGEGGLDLHRDADSVGEPPLPPPPSPFR